MSLKKRQGSGEQGARGIEQQGDSTPPVALASRFLTRTELLRPEIAGVKLRHQNLRFGGLELDGVDKEAGEQGAGD
jgi:hypothetical protein